MPSVVEVYKNAPLSICLTTEPMEGSANVTTAVRSGCADAKIKALLPMTHVSACESRSKYDSRLSSGANAKDEMLSLIIDTLRCGQGRSSPLFFELRRVLFLSGVTVGVSSFVGGVVLPACLSSFGGLLDNCAIYACNSESCRFSFEEDAILRVFWIRFCSRK